jgi:hypothetical protein
MPTQLTSDPDEVILAEAVKIFPNSRVAADLDRLAV